MIGPLLTAIGVASFDLSRGGLWLIEVNYKTSEARSRSTLVLEAGHP